MNFGPNQIPHFTPTLLTGTLFDLILHLILLSRNSKLKSYITLVIQNILFEKGFEKCILVLFNSFYAVWYFYI
jgi:hypothetical protein